MNASPLCVDLRRPDAESANPHRGASWGGDGEHRFGADMAEVYLALGWHPEYVWPYPLMRSLGERLLIDQSYPVSSECRA